MPKTNTQHIQDLYGNYPWYREDTDDSRFEPDAVDNDYDLGDMPYGDEMYLEAHDLV